METTDIQTVKEQLQGGYLVNGNIFVPDSPGNRHYRAVQEWITEGNTPEPAETEEEKQQRTRKELDSISVTSFQAKAALLNANLLDTVEQYIEDPATPRITKLAWQEASFKRKSPMVESIGTELGLTTEDLDNLFLAAQQIEV